MPSGVTAIAAGAYHSLFIESGGSPSSIASAANSDWSSLNTSPSRTYLWSDLPFGSVSANIVSTFQRLQAIVQPDFDAQTWRAFIRFGLEGRSAVDVGKELGMSETAVMNAKFRVLKRLRARISRTRCLSI